MDARVSEIESRLKRQLPENIQITSVEPVSSQVKSSVKRRNLRGKTKKRQNARSRES